MKKFDVIVSGAGPAGATCARALAQNGLSVLMLDKASFPRSKVCGGGFSTKARELFDFDLSSVIEAEIKQARISLASSRSALVNRPGGAGYMVCRERFDALLVEKAVSAGVRWHEQEALVNLQATEAADHWVVHTPRTTYQADFLVGADGVHSRVARLLGLMRKFDRYAPAIAAEVVVPADDLTAARDCAVFDFNLVPKGYAWIFPKTDHFSVGIYSTCFPLPGLRSALHQFIQGHDLFSRATVRNCKGGLIPRGGTRQRISRGRALLVGDAAAMTDPFFGEGIYYAARSGQLAAASILTAKHQQKKDLTDYERVCKREITSDLWWARMFNLTFYRFPGLFYPAIEKSAYLQNRVIDINSGRLAWKAGVGRIVAGLPCWLGQALLS